MFQLVFETTVFRDGPLRYGGIPTGNPQLGGSPSTRVAVATSVEHSSKYTPTALTKVLLIKS